MERNILLYLQNAFIDITFTKKDKNNLLNILTPKIHIIYKILHKNKKLLQTLKIDERFYHIFKNIFNLNSNSKKYTHTVIKKGGYSDELKLNIYENNNLLNYINHDISTDELQKHLIYIIDNYIETYKRLFTFNIKSFPHIDIDKSVSINPYLKEYIKNLKLCLNENSNIVNTRPFNNQLLQIYIKSLSNKNYINEISSNISHITQILNKDALYYLFIICKKQIPFMNNKLHQNKILLCHLIIYTIYSLEIAFKNIKFNKLNEKSVYFLIKILIISTIIISKIVISV